MLVTLSLALKEEARLNIGGSSGSNVMSSWYYDPVWVEAIGIWVVGLMAFGIACLQYLLLRSQAKAAESNKELQKLQIRTANATEEIAKQITLGPRLSWSRYSKDSIQKDYNDGKLGDTIEKIYGALRERINELNKDELKRYVDSAMKVMDDCDERRKKWKENEQMKREKKNE